MPTPPLRTVSDPARLAALHGFAVLDTPAEEGFDGIVELATQICACPVGLVSLVAADRQWFKARLNFPPCQTDLDSSVCAHALAGPDLLVIPDLAADPRTRDNPLVTAEPFIRFYAGAPLRTAEGHGLGTLCVIDHRPRPEGLTAPQRQALLTLAGQVMGQLELHRLLAAQKTALALSDALIRTQATVSQAGGDLGTILDALVAGAMEGVPHAEGGVIELRDGDELVYRSVAGTIAQEGGLRIPLGGSLAGACLLTGKPILCPDVLLDERAKLDVATRLGVRSCLLVPVLRGGEPVGVLKLQASRPGAFSRDDLRRARLFAGTVTAGLAEAAYREQSGLLDTIVTLGDRLNAATGAAEVPGIASAVVGRALGLSRAGYGEADPEAETLAIDDHWGGTPIGGVHRLREFGSFVDDLKRGAAVVVDDVALDPRTAAQAGRFHAVGVWSFVNLPVLERGRLVSVFFAHRDVSHHWTTSEVTFLRNVADRTRAAAARLEAEAEQAVLNGELSHRMKNTMAMVQAIAMQTLRNAADQDAVAAFTSRLHTLSTAHAILLGEQRTAAFLRTVAVAVLGAFGAPGRFDLDGPEVQLGQRAVLSFSLLLHELATNATKYGALSVPSGHVLLNWRVSPQPTGDELVVRWEERGGPVPSTADRKGFGSKLIRMGLMGSGGVEQRFAPSGLSIEMRAPLAHVQDP